MPNDQRGIEVEANIFDPPSGLVRRIVTGAMSLKGKRRRVVHATLLVDGPTQISLDIPAQVRLEDMRALAVGLQQFAERLQEYDPQVQT